MKDHEKPKPDPSSGLSRRDFMKISGIGVAVPLVLGPRPSTLRAKKSPSTDRARLPSR